MSFIMKYDEQGKEIVTPEEIEGLTILFKRNQLNLILTQKDDSFWVCADCLDIINLPFKNCFPTGYYVVLEKVAYHFFKWREEYPTWIKDLLSINTNIMKLIHRRGK